MSETEMACTTQESKLLAKMQTWQLFSLQLTGLRDAKSVGRLTAPAIWLMDTLYLLAVFKKVASRALVENSPLHRFLYASMHGLLSVNTFVL